MSQIYEVYICKMGDEVLYVGEGKRGRHKHSINGCSHVYRLNELHFKGIKLSVEILCFVKTKEEASKLEVKAVEFFKPKFNSMLQGGSKMNRETMQFKKFMKGYRKYDSSFKTTQRNKYYKIVDEFFSFHNWKGFIDGNERLYSRELYHKLELDSLSSLRRFMAEKHVRGDEYFCNVFCQAFLDYTGLDLREVQHFVNEGRWS